MEFLLQIPNRVFDFIIRSAKAKLKVSRRCKKKWLSFSLFSSKRYHISLLVLTFAIPITAFGQNVALIYDKDSRYQSSFVDTLSSQLSPTVIQLKHINSADLSIDALKKDLPDLIISLNDHSSTQLIASKLQTATFHALTTLSRSKHIAPCLPNCLSVLPNHLFFVLDQPFTRQLKLITLINPLIKNIGLIVTDHSALDWPEQQKTFHSLNVNKHITNTKSIRYQIGDISKSSDAILAVADTDIYNASTLSQILLTSYRYKTPVIGFSTGLIKAGALTGTISTLHQLAQHLAECLLKCDNTAEDKALSLIHPKYFEVFSNRAVAKSLNLHFPNDQKLTSMLSDNENIR